MSSYLQQIWRFLTGGMTDIDPLSVQNPVPTDGDSVYKKDIWREESLIDGWVSLDDTSEPIVAIPFTNLHTRIQNSSTDNPKSLTIHFNRTIRAQQIGLGCTGGGDFSNVKITLLGSGQVGRTVISDQTNNTKYTSRNFTFTNQLFNAVRLEFHTSDPVCLSNITIQKLIGVNVDQVEKTTNSLQTIPYSHAELHEGSAYFYKGWHTVTKNTFHDHLIIPPNTLRWSHFTVGLESLTSTILISLYEDPVISANGTIGQPRNRNRNYPDNNTLLIYESPAVTSVGNLLGSYKLGSGKNSPGGSARDSEEIVLRQNTKYLLRVTEMNISNTDVNFSFDWYEHTNLNTL